MLLRFSFVYAFKGIAPRVLGQTRDDFSRVQSGQNYAGVFQQNCGGMKILLLLGSG